MLQHDGPLNMILSEGRQKHTKSHMTTFTGRPCVIALKQYCGLLQIESGLWPP